MSARLLPTGFLLYRQYPVAGKTSANKRTTPNATIAITISPVVLKFLVTNEGEAIKTNGKTSKGSVKSADISE
jgi:hypothetical protein